MVADELQQGTHRQHGEDERGDEADGEHRQVLGAEQVAVHVSGIDRRADHGRHRQEERELGGRLARKAEQQAADDGRAGPRGAGDHRQALGTADLQGVLPGHVVDVFGADHMLPALGPEHDHPAHHQRQGDGDRIEQPLVDQVGEQDAEDYRREERDQQVGGETLGLALARQVTDDLKDLSPKFPDDSEDRRQLDDDVERLGAFAAEADEVGDDDLVPGAGNRQELGQPLHDAQDERLESSPPLHVSPPSTTVPNELSLFSAIHSPSFMKALRLRRTRPVPPLPKSKPAGMLPERPARNLGILASRRLNKSVRARPLRPGLREAPDTFATMRPRRMRAFRVTP